MSGRIAIQGDRVVTADGERPATVVLEGGRIAAVLDRHAAVTSEVLQLPEDCALLPGLVDTHVHVNEPGRTDWEGFATATRAAAAGGITTVVDMPLNSIPATVDVPALVAKQARAASRSWVDVGFWGGAVPTNLTKLAALHRAGVAGFKCFLAPSGVPEFPPLTPAQLIPVMTRIAEFGGLLIVHAEAPELLADCAGPQYADFLASRPPAAEQVAVARLVAAAARTGCRTHVVHVSSSAAVAELRAAKVAGVPISAETCPHYLLLRADEVPAGATEFKCCPPIRDGEHQQALWTGLLDGTVDCVVSDHSPCSPADKRLDTGDFGAAWGGIAGLQLSLAVTWTAARGRGVTLAQLAQWMATGPAALVGLTDRGAIAPGLRADLCVLAPEAEFPVEEASLEQRHPSNPYTGRTLRGVVRQTWLAGRPVDLSDGPRGEMVVRPAAAVTGDGRAYGASISPIPPAL